jgi:hypothetical protein
MVAKMHKTGLSKVMKAVDSARPPQQADTRPVCTLDVFFAELASHLDVEDGMITPLQAARPFSGPAGLICRIETRQDGGDLRARPQLLLPLNGDEIRRLEVSKLLSMQATLLTQLGWVLGHSAEGLLQLAPVEWTGQAKEVARELELGSAVGRLVLAMLHTGPLDAQPSKAH